MNENKDVIFVDQFPSDYVHAQMCLDIYFDYIKEGDVRLFSKKDESWLAYKVYRIPEVDYALDLDTELFVKIKHISRGAIYSAVLYLNESKKQIVLASRGIELDMESLSKVNDALHFILQSTLLNDTLPQLAYCFKVTDEANLIAREKGCCLSFTGYSNGAWLAENSLFFSCHHFKNQLVKAVLFESPGTSMSRNNLEGAHVTNYLTSPHLMNSANSHVDKIYRLYLDKEKFIFAKCKFIEKLRDIPYVGHIIYEKLKLSDFLIDGLNSMYDHKKKMHLILERFNTESGQPLEAHTEEILEWPLVKVEFETNLLSDINVETVERQKTLKALSEYFTKIFDKIIDGLQMTFLHKGTPGLRLILNVLVEIVREENVNLEFFDEPSFYKRLKESNENILSSSSSETEIYKSDDQSESDETNQFSSKIVRLTSKEIEKINRNINELSSEDENKKETNNVLNTLRSKIRNIRNRRRKLVKKIIRINRSASNSISESNNVPDNVIEVEQNEIEGNKLAILFYSHYRATQYISNHI